ncbi:hypothetical protein [Georgenia alba]|uniref:ARB-07466-like C-terminal domain-containing protein n=1 Tax=Georgenia alba TaxID=2233858 RepID=A0ABW2Q3E0_9MICO
MGRSGRQRRLSPTQRLAARRRVRLVRSALVFLLLVTTATSIDALDGPPTYRPAMNLAPHVELPAAPEPWSGQGRGCTEPDPAGTDGCVTPAMAWLVDQLTFTDASLTCWSEHEWNPESDHPHGRGCDLYYGRSGAFADGQDLIEGWRAARWLQVHAEALHVHYIIWQGRIWEADRPEAGWVPYNGAGVYDPGDATGGHFDHVHVSVRG